jgi:hypothetical protein
MNHNQYYCVGVYIDAFPLPRSCPVLAPAPALDARLAASPASKLEEVGVVIVQRELGRRTAQVSENPAPSPFKCSLPGGCSPHGVHMLVRAPTSHAHGLGKPREEWHKVPMRLHPPKPGIIVLKGSWGGGGVGGRNCQPRRANSGP